MHTRSVVGYMNQQSRNRIIFLYLQGLKFKKFPYLLTLQLKRFDFDYTTMHRIKLNDRWVWLIYTLSSYKTISDYRMSFPNVLDLNDFVNGDDEVCNLIDPHLLSLSLSSSLSLFLSQMSPAAVV